MFILCIHAESQRERVIFNATLSLLLKKKKKKDASSCKLLQQRLNTYLYVGQAAFLMFILLQRYWNPCYHFWVMASVSPCFVSSCCYSTKDSVAKERYHAWHLSVDTLSNTPKSVIQQQCCQLCSTVKNGHVSHERCKFTSYITGCSCCNFFF